MLRPASGSSVQIAAELFKESAGVEIFHVPYKGGAPAVADVIGNHVDMTFASWSQCSASKSRAGPRAGGHERQALSAAPDVPTIRRVRSAWVRVFVLVRSAGSGGYAAGHYQKAQCRDCEGASVVGYDRAAVRGRCRTDCEYARGIRHVFKEQTARWTKVIRAAGIQQIE